MALVFWEPASLSCGITEAFKDRRNLLISIEILCLLFHVLVFILYALVSGFSYVPMFWSKPPPKFNAKIKEQKSNTLDYWPFFYCITMLIIALDLFFRIVISSASSANSVSFSRPLRSVFLILNFQVLRQKAGAILRMIPSIFLLCLGLVLIGLLYSVVGFNLMRNVYPSYPENFDSLSNALVSLFVLSTSENYPDVMWPAYRIYPAFSLIFFISYLCISGVILAAVLGVIFDTYRISVLKDAWSSFQTERTGIFAAFSLLCEEDLDGIHKVTFKSWKQCFLLFSRHGSSSFVYQVYDRNLGALRKSREMLSMDAPEDAPEDIDCAIDNILKSQFEKHSVGGMIKLSDFFSLCDRIRTNLELHEDHEILLAKEKWKTLESALKSVNSKTDLESITFFDRLYENAKLILSRASGTIPRAHFRPAVQSELEAIDEQEISGLGANQSKEHADSRFVDSKDQKAYEEDVVNKCGRQILSFQVEFSMLSITERDKIRKFIQNQLSSSGNLRLNTFVNRLIAKSRSEGMIESTLWVVMTHSLIITFCLFQITAANSSQSIPVLNALILSTVFLFVLEITTKAYAMSFSAIKSTKFIIEALLVVSSFVGSIGLLSQGEFQMNAAKSINWDQRIFKALAALPVFRLVLSFVSLSMHFWMKNVREDVQPNQKNTTTLNEDTHTRLLALQNLIWNVFKVLFILSVLLFSFTYFWAVVGLELFGCLDKDPSLEEYTNFSSITGAFLVLMQCLFSNNWNEIMYSAINQTSTWSSLYFLSFYAVTSLVILNLFAAFIAESIEKIKTRHQNMQRQSLFNGKTTFGVYSRYVA